MTCARELTSGKNAETVIKEINSYIEKHRHDLWLAKAFWGLADLLNRNRLQRYGYFSRILGICEAQPDKYPGLDKIYFKLGHDAKILGFNDKSIMYLEAFQEKYPEHPWYEMAEHHLSFARIRSERLEDEMLSVVLEDLEDSSLSQSKTEPSTIKLNRPSLSNNLNDNVLLDNKRTRASDKTIPMSNVTSHPRNCNTYYYLKAGIIATVLFFLFLIRLRKSNKVD